MRARKYCRFAVCRGAVPVAPHLLFPQFLDERTERELALSMGLELLERCSQVWVFGRRISEGMRSEIARAGKRKIKIRYFTEELKEV